PASARARPARVGPICRHCIAGARSRGWPEMTVPNPDSTMAAEAPTSNRLRMSITTKKKDDWPQASECVCRGFCIHHPSLLSGPPPGRVRHAGGLELLLEPSQFGLESAQLRRLRVELVVGDRVVHLLRARRRPGEAARTGSGRVDTRLNRRRRTGLEAAQGFVAAESALDVGDAPIELRRVVQQRGVA